VVNQALAPRTNICGKIATFAKLQTVKLSKNPLGGSMPRACKPAVSRISELSYFAKHKTPSVKGRKNSHQSTKSRKIYFRRLPSTIGSKIFKIRHKLNATAIRPTSAEARSMVFLGNYLALGVAPFDMVPLGCAQGKLFRSPQARPRHSSRAPHY